VAAKAAELTAVAAVKAGPIAQKAAEVTSDAGQKLAERAQTLATELRGESAGAPAEDISWAEGGASPAPDTGAPAATFEDATDSTTSTAGSTFDDTSSTDRNQGSGTASF
jgi:hypothetical protein